MGGVSWRRVGLFYGMALGWVVFVAVVLRLFGQDNFAFGAANPVAQLAVGVFYMPAPLVAALIVDRMDGRRPLIVTTFDGFGRKLPRLLLVGGGAVVASMAAMLGLSWVLGNLLGVPGAGRLTTGRAEMVANASAALGLPSEVVADGFPEFWPMIGMLLVASVVAGFSANGLFAFGEEYGWRGWLADELRPLGAGRANVLTGAMWGLWHTPLIVEGFNFAPYNYVGPLFMVALCVPFSFLLWRVREVTGSLLAPAVVHGGFNAFAGVFVFVLADRNPLIAVPVGLAGAASVAILVSALWLLPARPAPSPATAPA